jgi:hydrogenase expression/formation protein HypE
MNARLPDLGKISPEVFEEIILPQLGARDPSVVVGPRSGVDVGVIEIGDTALALTTDPVFIVPEYGWERAAWFAIHILCSDAVTSGLAPRYLAIDLNLPLAITKEQIEIMWRVIHRECEKLGVAIVTGHTARYQGCGYPMVGGATVVAVGPKDSYVTPTMARPGDRVLITKGPAVEASGLFAVTFPDVIAEAYGREFAERAEGIFWKMSVVEDAMTAVSIGVRDNGVTAMHDATECGIWGALCEVADASGVGMRILKDNIVTDDDALRICDLFGMDPYKAISEGTLVLTVRPHKTAQVLAALHAKGIAASDVGEVVEASRGIRVVDGARELELVHPRVDPFWAAFGAALAKYRDG